MEFARIYPNEMKQGEFVLSMLHTTIRFYGSRKECENLKPEFEKDARRMHLKELRRYGIYPVDVVGGRMWYCEQRQQHAWDIREFLPWIPDDRAEEINEEFTYQL